jgi:hypothetical protein
MQLHGRRNKVLTLVGFSRADINLHWNYELWKLLKHGAGRGNRARIKRERARQGN